MTKTDRFLLTCILFFGIGCANTDQEIKDLEEYTGPLQETFALELLHSDSAVIRIKLISAHQIVHQNHDQEYPEGIFLEIYNKSGDLTTIKANRAYFTKETKIYQVEGDVELINNKEKQKLNTEELFWNPQEEKVYTDRFVTIITEGEMIKGEGLEANQDFSSYKILNPKGTISIVED